MNPPTPWARRREGPRFRTLSADEMRLVLRNVEMHVARAGSTLPPGELATCLPYGGGEEARNFASKFASPTVRAPTNVTWTCLNVEIREAGAVYEFPASRIKKDPSRA